MNLLLMGYWLFHKCACFCVKLELEGEDYIGNIINHNIVWFVTALIFSKDILVHMLLMNKRLFWYGIWIEITVQFSNIKCINTCHPQFYQPAILCLSWWNSALYLPYATVTNAMKQFNEMIPFVNQIMTLFKKSIIRSAIFSIIYHMSYFSVLSTYI